MTIIKPISLFMIPAIIIYTLISLSVPLTAHAEARLTPFVPESAESLPIEADVRPRQQEPETKGGSNWWKWTLGILLVGGIAAAAGGGGGGGGGGDTATTTGGGGGGTPTGGATVTGSW